MNQHAPTAANARAAIPRPAPPPPPPDQVTTPARQAAEPKKRGGGKKGAGQTDQDRPAPEPRKRPISDREQDQDRLAARLRSALDSAARMSVPALAANIRTHLARQDLAAVIPDDVLAGMLLAQLSSALSLSSSSATDRAAAWRILGASWAWTSVANSGSLAPVPAAAAQDQAHVAEAAARGAASGAAIAGAAVADLVAEAIARADRMARERASGQQSVIIEGRAEPEPRVSAGLSGGVHLLGEQVHAAQAVPARLPEPVARSTDPLMDWRD